MALPIRNTCFWFGVEAHLEPQLDPNLEAKNPCDPPLGNQDSAGWGQVGGHVGPSGCQDGPSSAQVSAKMEKMSPLGAKTAQVGPKVSKKTEKGIEDAMAAGRGGPP